MDPILLEAGLLLGLKIHQFLTINHFGLLLYRQHHGKPTRRMYPILIFIFFLRRIDYKEYFITFKKVQEIF